MDYALGGIIADRAAEISAALFFMREHYSDIYVTMKMRSNFNSTKS